MNRAVCVTRRLKVSRHCALVRPMPPFLSAPKLCWPLAMRSPGKWSGPSHLTVAVPNRGLFSATQLPPEITTSVSDLPAVSAEKQVWLSRHPKVLAEQEAKDLLALLQKRNTEKKPEDRLAVWLAQNYKGLPSQVSAKRDEELDRFTTELHKAVFPTDTEGITLLYCGEQRSLRWRTYRLSPEQRHAIQEQMFAAFRQGQTAKGLGLGIAAIDQALEAQAAKAAGTPFKKRSWWSDWKDWNRAMARGERPVATTALWGAGWGVFLYYTWQALKAGLGACLVLYLAWRLYKYWRRHYSQPEPELVYACTRSSSSSPPTSSGSTAPPTEGRSSTGPTPPEIKPIVAPVVAAAAVAGTAMAMDTDQKDLEDEHRIEKLRDEIRTIQTARTARKEAASAAAQKKEAHEAEQARTQAKNGAEAKAKKRLEEERQAQAQKQKEEEEEEASRRLRRHAQENVERQGAYLNWVSAASGSTSTSTPASSPTPAATASSATATSTQKETQVPGAVKAAGVGASAAVLNRDFQTHRADKAAAGGISWDSGSSGSTESSGSSRSSPSSGSSWGSGSSGSSWDSGSSGSSWGSSSSASSSASSGGSW